MTACPGSCNSEYRKVRAIYDAAVAAYDGQLARLADGDEVPDPPPVPELRPWEGYPVWCRRCTAQVRVRLAELDELAAMLAVLPPGIRPASDGQRVDQRVSGTPEARSPSPSGDELDELQRWLLGWEATWRQANAWPSPPQRGILARTITSAVAWLGAHLDDLLASQEHSQQFGGDVSQWHSRLRRTVHAASFARFVKKPCPSPPKGCGRFTLWEKVGEPYISCVNPDCGRRLTREELELETA